MEVTPGTKRISAIIFWSLHSCTENYNFAKLKELGGMTVKRPQPSKNNYVQFEKYRGNLLKQLKCNDCGVTFEKLTTGKLKLLAK